MTLKIYAVARPWNVRNVKNEVMAALAGVKIEHVPVTLGQYETPEFFRNCHPLGRSPVLETPDGYIFESSAILRYIARLSKVPYFGSTPFEAACCDMWVDYATIEIDEHTFAIVRKTLFNEPNDVEAHVKATKEALAGVEQWLETRTFIACERMSVADVAIASSIWFIMMWQPDGDVTAKAYRNCMRLYNTVMQQPAVINALRDIGTSFLPPIKPKEEAAPKPAPAAKPAATPAAAAAAADDDDDAPKEPKKVNPLDSLPPSTFVLDAFKREYSNNDTRTVAAPYFFKNYDPEGFTCFWCKYLYNSELKKSFMTANLVRGWFQRMEHNRKYAFGVALIIGEEQSQEICGFWVFRGKGMPACVKEVEDTELFAWTEIPDVAGQAAAITDYLCWEGPTIGRPVIEGRVFK